MMPSSPQVFGRRQIEERRGTKQRRGYGGEWERISKIFRAQHPVCQECLQNASEDVDHVIPFNGLKDPLRTSWSNLRALCRACHNRKTHAKH